ncbi:MAG: helix-turn-helix transcriptional regulator [Candidatus Nanopelagicales bacterium]|nr:helix-turn-helix transcriptional regulator [Candidatus Nanopelagicales bacterium]
MASFPPTPLPVVAAQRQLGEHFNTWRRLRRLTRDEVAQRAAISVATIARLENGHGASLENTLRIARALGVTELLVNALDPYNTDIGRLRADEELPVRIRHGKSS